MAPFLDPRLVVEPTIPSEMWEKKQDVHAPTPCSTNATIALRSRVGVFSRCHQRRWVSNFTMRTARNKSSIDTDSVHSQSNIFIKDRKTT